MTEKLEQYEVQELADFLLKIENSESDYDITEGALCDKWNISYDVFEEITNKIFKSLDFGISPLTNTTYIGFSKGDEWIVKKEVDQKFIHALINWCCDGQDFPKKTRGFIKTITKDNEPEFEIIIRRPNSEYLEVENKIKADKWDKLQEKISKYYEEDSEGDLLDIGEAAASAFGFL